MKAILNGINGIIEFFNMIKELIVNLVSNVLELIKLLTTIPTNLGILIGTLPPWLMAVATTTLGVAIIYMLLGRETGK